MASKLLIPLCALALIGCARHTIPQVTLIPQTRLGTEEFGPGIVSYTSARMDFVLDASAHVIVLRVSDSRGVETVQPLRSGDRSTELARGKHHVMAPAFRFVRSPGGYGGVTTCTWGGLNPYTQFGGAFDSTGAFRQAVSSQSYESCVRHEQAHTAMFQFGDPSPRRREGVNEAYWLLIASDVPTGADDLQERLALMEWPGSALTAVRNLPEALVGGRTTRWAASSVLVSDSPRRKSGY